MEEQRRLLAIDLGSGKIAAIVAEINAGNEVRVLGIGKAPSTGMRAGRIVNIEKTASSIAQAVSQAIQMAKADYKQVVVGITGDHIKGVTSRGFIAISNPHLEITQEDVERVLEQAKTISIPMGREVIYVHPNSYTIDDQKGVKEPVGMIGIRLEVEAYIVTAQSTVLMNIRRALSKADVENPQLLFQPIAASMAVLRPQDMEQGVVLIDIGKDTTDIAVWYEGDLVHTVVIPIGGSFITNDIAIGLKIPVDKAEEVKLAYGVASPKFVEDEDEHFEVESTKRLKVFKTRELAYIIEARVAEILELAREKIDQSDQAGRLAGGVVLVGGTSKLKGIDLLAEEILGLPVNIGEPYGVTGLIEPITDPSFAVVVGLPRLAKLATTKGLIGDEIGGSGWKELLRRIWTIIKENF
ncbi:MAG: cell division protein FtsA [Candidatus Hydrothermota bacterium]|nr:MAG: cell division protein FtsA [Candidatus Hydrothermae bacterium]